MERAFPLAGLLRLRALQEDSAAARLAVSNAALRAARQRRESTRDDLLGYTLPTQAGAPAWRQSVTRRAVLADLLADAGQAVDDADVRVGADTADWMAARARSVGLEKLHDKHRAAVAVEDGRAEQRTLDEIAARTATGTTTLGAPAAGAVVGRQRRGPSATEQEQPR